mmetsp:Transcript_43582/g.115056  ORF Transcript_43582/g.115056 Transcript_43582/m.115056 type:complete len:269 (+) Transcript_43582:248-1054(+)
MPGPSHLHIQHPLVRRERRLIPKRRVPRQELKSKHAQRPPVHLHPVPGALDHLRRQVVRGTPECEGHVHDDLGEPEIAELHVPVVVNEHILGLEIAVADLHGVQVLKSEDHLRAVELGVIIGQSPLLPQMTHELAPDHILQQEEQPVVILERGEQVDQERVLHDLQNRLFRSQMLDLLQTQHLVLLEDFQGERVPVRRALHLHDPHAGKGACPHRRQQIEISDGECPAGDKLLQLRDGDHMLESMMNVGFGRHGCQPPAESRPHLGIA